jgi:predicted phosphate transport protein (TIGR00153 family)
MFEKRLGFLSRGEGKLVQSAVTNLDVSIDASSHVLALVNQLKMHNYDVVLKEHHKIDELEAHADSLHMKLVESISQGSFFGGIREDFLQLVEEIDNIADAAKDCSKVFSQRRISDSSIDLLFQKDVGAFIESCIETAKLFRSAILALEKNKNEVLKLAAEVEKSEEKADGIRGEILENLLMKDGKVDILDIVMLKDFLNIADNIADHSEDGSDILLMLVTKGYA